MGKKAKFKYIRSSRKEKAKKYIISSRKEKETLKHIKPTLAWNLFYLELGYRELYADICTII